MIQVRFKNLEPSELAKDTAIERLSAIAEKFPDFFESQIRVTLSMENSPTQAGRDVFTVKVHCARGKYRGVLMERSSSSLYAALAEVVDRLLERLNRFGDRRRVQRRKQARDLSHPAPPVALDADSSF